MEVRPKGELPVPFSEKIAMTYSILSRVLVLWVPDIVLYVNAMFTLYNLEGLNFTGHGSR